MQCDYSNEMQCSATTVKVLNPPPLKCDYFTGMQCSATTVKNSTLTIGMLNPPPSLEWNASSSPSPPCTGTTEHSVKKLLQRRSKCSSAFQGGKMQALNRHPNFHHNEEFQSLTREGCCILHKLQQSLCQINSTPNLIQNGRVWKNIDFSGESNIGGTCFRSHTLQRACLRIFPHILTS